jgi:hypothetical protein
MSMERTDPRGPDKGLDIIIERASKLNVMEVYLGDLVNYIPPQYQREVQIAMQSLFKQSTDLKRILIAAIPELSEVFPGLE